MVAQKGRAMLVKIGDGASPEVFTTIGGAQTDTLSLSKEQVDISNKSSTEHWREVLAGAAVKNVEVSSNGIFIDDTQIETVRAAFFASSLTNYQIVVPDFGTFEGPFDVTGLEFTGENANAVQQTIGLSSAGQITFTAA